MTVALLAAIYYYAAFTTQDSRRIRVALLWFGTIALAALLRFEMPVEWVAVASWAAMAVALYSLARLAREPSVFLEQCYAMTLLCGVRCALDDFYQLSPWYFADVRTATVIACALLRATCCSPAAKLRPDRQKGESVENSRELRCIRAIAARRGPGSSPANSACLFFFVPTILITVTWSAWKLGAGFLAAASGRRRTDRLSRRSQDGRARLPLVAACCSSCFASHAFSPWTCGISMPWDGWFPSWVWESPCCW